MRLAILPTGRTEWHGLPGALGRLFPGHDLIALPSQQEIASESWNRHLYHPALVADHADAKAPSVSSLAGQRALLTSRFVLLPEPVLRNPLLSHDVRAVHTSVNNLRRSKATSCGICVPMWEINPPKSQIQHTTTMTK